MGILDKVKGWLGQNPDKANTAIDKVGDFIDQKTQGKYAEQVDKAQDAARKHVGGDQTGTQGDPTPPQPKPGDQGDPTPPQPKPGDQGDPTQHP